MLRQVQTIDLTADATRNMSETSLQVLWASVGAVLHSKKATLKNLQLGRRAADAGADSRL